MNLSGHSLSQIGLWKHKNALAKVAPMGSSLVSTLANAFLCFHNQIWLNECPDEFKPVYHRRYVDDIFVLFRSPVHLGKFQNYLNSKPRNIRFTCEKEHNNSMP